MSTQWFITRPGGEDAIPLAEAGISDISIRQRIMATSSARAAVVRDYDSVGGWWAADSLCTIYRSEDGGETLAPVFTGRVIETPASANGESETRTLQLADAWMDLEDIVYQESWAIGGSTVMIPKVILGLSPAGESISTGAQIRAAVTYAASQGAEIQLGTVADGVSVWPSEAANISCADVIRGEMRWNPSYAAWIDHTTSPPTFHARPQSALTEEAVNIADGNVEAFDFSKMVRTIPRGVRILYEDAANLDGTIYRNAYLDEAGETTGRRIMHATIELAGMQQQRQKSRVRVREIPAEGTAEEQAAAQKAFLIANFPALADFPAPDWEISNFKTTLVPDPSDHPNPICTKAARIAVTEKSDLPNQLLNGTIEDWMRKKTGQITISYDFKNLSVPINKAIQAFAGDGRTFTVTATNADTRLYKSTNSFTEGEGRPTGIAAAVFAAASADKYEGSITLVGEDVPNTTWLGKTIRLMDGATTIMPATVIHSASWEIVTGRVALEFGALPYFSAGDFLELQRMARGRPVTWMSGEERASNELGAEENASAGGDTVSGYVFPEVITAPGGGGADSPCAFGEIITYEGDTFILGGVLYAGDQNWNVPNEGISLSADTERLVWLEVGITANTEDSVLMPGLETSDEPTWENGTIAGGYPDNTPPDVGTGVGVRIVPLGVLTIVDGVASFDPVGCGSISLGFCPPNTLSITRG